MGQLLKKNPINAQCVQPLNDNECAGVLVYYCAVSAGCHFPQLCLENVLHFVLLDLLCCREGCNPPKVAVLCLQMLPDRFSLSTTSYSCLALIGPLRLPEKHFERGHSTQKYHLLTNKTLNLKKQRKCPYKKLLLHSKIQLDKICKKATLLQLKWLTKHSAFIYPSCHVLF